MDQRRLHDIFMTSIFKKVQWDLRTKYTGRSTSITSPIMYKYESQLCFLRDFASVGQLSTRVTVVSHFFGLVEIVSGGDGSDL